MHDTVLTKPFTTQSNSRRPLILVILDGWGSAPEGPFNAIALAHTPTLDFLTENYPHTLLYAHGTHVGLPDNQVGNSEAGHMNIGAGRTVVQDSVIISTAIRNGSFFKNHAFLSAIDHVKKNGSALHIMGILSGEQCPHMSPDHLIALCAFVKSHGLAGRTFWHFFTDGRDSPPHAALSIWESIRKNVKGALRPVSGARRLYF